MLLSYILLLLFAAVIRSLPTGGDFKVIDRLKSVPKGWTQADRASPSQTVQFRLAVRLDQSDLLDQAVLDISTPGNALYGRHFKRDELKAFLRPRSQVTDDLLLWLTSNGIEPEAIQHNGDWINFATTIEVAERLLNTRFYNFIDDQSQETIIRTLEYSVASSVAAYVQMIQPTTMFGRLRPQTLKVYRPQTGLLPDATSSPATPCGTWVTPSCIREQYSLRPYSPGLQNTSRLGISGFLEEYAQYNDLQLFLKQFAPECISGNFSVTSINGGLNIQNPESDTTEANLDMQYSIALSNSKYVKFYSTSGRGELIPDLDQPDISSNMNEPFLDQLHYLLDLPDNELPHVLSTSYGENEQSVPETYAQSACSLFAQLGARGVSVIFSSGDTGVGSACQSNDGKNTTKFNPIFPATCPFVTSVGATRGSNPEAALYFSSGGFSEIFRRPSYQDQAISRYLEQLGDKWHGLYNPSGRGFPDIAALGYNYLVCDRRSVAQVSGTSASAPTIAAIISNLNTVRFSQGKGPLGFLNPWLYSGGYKGFTDIVDGGSNGCTGEDLYSGLPTPYIPYASWNATDGWDPVSGFGTPNFEKLVILMP